MQGHTPCTGLPLPSPCIWKPMLALGSQQPDLAFPRTSSLQVPPQIPTNPSLHHLHCVFSPLYKQNNLSRLCGRRLCPEYKQYKSHTANMRLGPCVGQSKTYTHWIPQDGNPTLTLACCSSLWQVDGEARTALGMYLGDPSTFSPGSLSTPGSSYVWAVDCQAN